MKVILENKLFSLLVSGACGLLSYGGALLADELVWRSDMDKVQTAIRSNKADIMSVKKDTKSMYVLMLQDRIRVLEATMYERNLTPVEANMLNTYQDDLKNAESRVGG